MTNGAGRRRTESHPFTKRANMCADNARHWMPAVSPLLVEGDENWFRRQPYSRVRKPHTAAVSSALTPHIVQESCHGVDHPPRSHRRRIPTRTTLPAHLRSANLSARSFASFRSARLHPWPLDSRSPEGWAILGAWWVEASSASERCNCTWQLCPKQAPISHYQADLLAIHWLEPFQNAHL